MDRQSGRAHSPPPHCSNKDGGEGSMEEEEKSGEGWRDHSKGRGRGL